MQEVTKFNVVLINRDDPSITISYTHVNGFNTSGNHLYVEIETGAIQSYLATDWKHLVTEYQVYEKLPPV